MKKDKVYKSDDAGKKFLFSVVVAIYNSEKYLEEAILSVVGQDVGFTDNVQLILVNDGSEDGSLDICLKYYELYPENIVVIDQNNSGVSKARNNGVAFATGKYINFLDSDDYFSKNAFRSVKNFFAKYEKDVDVVTIKTELCGEKKGDTWFNRKFDKGTRVINLWKEPQIYLNATNTTFFHKRIKNQLHFDENMTIAEDLKVVNTALMNKWNLGVVSDALYYYRIHSASLVDTAKKKENYYIPYLKNIFFWFYEKSTKQCGFFPEFLQYTLFRELYNRLIGNTEAAAVLSAEDYEEYKGLLISALKKIDQKVIRNNSFCNSDHHVYFLSLQKGAPAVSSDGVTCNYSWDNVTISKKPFYSITHLDFCKNNLVLEGYFVINNVFSQDVSLYYKDGEGDFQEIIPLITPNDDSYSFGKEVLFYRKHFKLTFPMKSGNNHKLSFYFGVYGKYIPFSCFSQGQWSPLNNMKTSYFYKDGFVAFMDGVAVKIESADGARRRKLEKAFRKELKKIGKTSEEARHSLWMRRFYYGLLGKIYRRKNIWIISDRHAEAGDNGEALMKYLVKKPSGVTPFFAIDKDKKNTVNFPSGKIISFGTKKYKWKALFAKAFISSHFDRNELFFADYTYIKDIISQKKFVFLQHGITKDDVSKFYNRNNQHLEMFVTVTYDETKSIIENDDYFCGEEHTALLGMPRFDLLEDRANKTVIIAPTWRQKAVIFKGKEGVFVRDEFAQSKYYLFYHDLLSDEKVQQTAKKLGYKICYFPHFNMMATNGFFKDIPNIEIIEKGRDYRKYFSEASIWITDYSSTAFDFAYLGKPVIYCQSDKKEFFSSHTYTEGYFDYERDGFGEVVFDKDTAAKLICEYMENGCKIKDKYLERINNTFAFRDKNNSQRIVKAVKERTNGK